MTQSVLFILLVEDNPLDATFTRKLLEPMTLPRLFDVTIATTHEEGLRYLAERNFDCVITDLDLPDSTGLAGPAALHAAHPALPIIVLTGREPEDDFAAAALESGADDYLVKDDLSPRMLKRTVRYAIERRRLVHKQRSLDDRLRALLEIAPQGIFTADGEGMVTYTNKHWQDLTGQSFTESLGRGWWGALHPEDLPAIFAHWGTAVTAKTQFLAEMRLRDCATQGWRWHLARAVPLLDGVGRVQQWVGAASDLHDAKIQSQELARAKEEAESANVAKSNFLANMSHEIRTPLGAIIGFAEFLRDQSISFDEHNQYLDVIQRNGRALANLIDDILDLSKVEAGRMDVQLARCSLPLLLGEIVEALTLKAQETNTSLIVGNRGTVPESICTDRSRLRQILTNVIGNAVKFTPRGTVSVMVALQDDQLIIDVEDTGRGISDRQAARLFQVFAQADSSTTRDYGGSGLGLVLARRLAHMLGGDVVLSHSQLGIGSSFRVSIDAGLAGLDSVRLLSSLTAAADDKSHDADSPGNAASSELLGLRVLVADDAPDNRYLIRRILTKRGAKVEIAENGAEAVEKAVLGTFDLVVMDVQMPVLDGYGATAQLRKHNFRGPILALTAHAMKEDRERCLAAGCDDYMTKPVDSSLLVAKILAYELSGAKGQ